MPRPLHLGFQMLGECSTAEPHLQPSKCKYFGVLFADTATGLIAGLREHVLSYFRVICSISEAVSEVRSDIEHTAAFATHRTAAPYMGYDPRAGTERLSLLIPRGPCLSFEVPGSSQIRVSLESGSFTESLSIHTG